MEFSFPHPTDKILITLFLWCVLYAFLLDRLHGRYTADFLIVTVIVGCSAILEAMAVISSFGFFPWAAIEFLAYCDAAAGIPIAIWQAVQFTRNHAARREIARRKERHAHGAIRQRGTRGR